MKNNKKYLFSLFLCLFVLLIIGQREIVRTKNLLADLRDREIDNFVFASNEFAAAVNNEADPFVLLANSQKIKEILLSKCRLKENVFLQNADGQDLVLNCFGDAGVIQYELERGGKIISADEKMELDYFRNSALPIFESRSFSSGQIAWYFIWHILLIILLVYLPFFFSVKLFFLALGVMILVMSLSCLRKNFGTEKVKTLTEYCLKEIPPELSPQVPDSTICFLAADFIIPAPCSGIYLMSKTIVFPRLVIGAAQKVCKKIFHIPIFSFVEQRIKIENNLTKLKLSWKKKIYMKPTNCWASCRMTSANSGLKYPEIAI